MYHTSHKIDVYDPQELNTTEYRHFTVSSQENTPVVIEFALNGQPLQMELDTGASISLISEQQYNQL